MPDQHSKENREKAQLRKEVNDEVTRKGRPLSEEEIQSKLARIAELSEIQKSNQKAKEETVQEVNTHTSTVVEKVGSQLSDKMDTNSIEIKAKMDANSAAMKASTDEIKADTVAIHAKLDRIEEALTKNVRPKGGERKKSRTRRRRNAMRRRKKRPNKRSEKTRLAWWRRRNASANSTRQTPRLRRPRE